MTRYAIGDIQGCYDELRTLVAQIGFSPDRDQLWFTGDLVNRGPRSLEVLRYVRSLGHNAVTVLGNHDLHLLAVAYGTQRKTKAGDTIDDILAAPDRDQLLEWLLERPLVHAEGNDLLLHAGVVPQWSARATVGLASEVEAALRRDARKLFDNMYGDQPDRWDEQLEGLDRLRFIINVLTRLRVCTPDGRVDLKMKGKPESARPAYRPWFEIEGRASRNTRVVFGHWSAAGLVQSHGVLGLDTGCVWGGRLTAFDLDAGGKPLSVACAGCRTPGEE